MYKFICLCAVFFFATSLFAKSDTLIKGHTTGGMYYEVYRNAEATSKIKIGNIIKVRGKQTVKDSVHFSTYNGLSVFISFLQVLPYDISEVWEGLQKGDSIFAVQLLDTFINRNPDVVPPQYKRTDSIKTSFVILDFFKDQAVATAEKNKEEELYLASEITFLKNHLSQKRIRTVQTKSGVFIQTINPGKGVPISPGMKVKAMYKGYTLGGKIFDTNMDNTFSHTEPIEFKIGDGSMIKGFNEGVDYLRVGAEARIYVPSMLGYASSSPTPLIKPYEHLVFHLKIVSAKKGK